MMSSQCHLTARPRAGLSSRPHLWLVALAGVTGEVGHCVCNSCPVIGCSGLLPTLWSSSVQFSSVAQSCPILCDPKNCSTPGLPVHHQLPEFTQTHIHRVCDAIQPSHPLSSPFPPAPNPIPESFPMSQLFACGGQSTGLSALASFLPKNTQD